MGSAIRNPPFWVAPWIYGNRQKHRQFFAMTKSEKHPHLDVASRAATSCDALNPEDRSASMMWTNHALIGEHQWNIVEKSGIEWNHCINPSFSLYSNLIRWCESLNPWQCRTSTKEEINAELKATPRFMGIKTMVSLYNFLLSNTAY